MRNKSESVKRSKKIKRPGKKKLIIIAAAAVLIAAAGTAWFIFRDTVFSTFFSDAPSRAVVTVAWNPGSIADDVACALADVIGAELTLQNVPGANGANGANAVFGAESDGESLLSTSLSALVTSEAMGFADSWSHRDWAAWLCAFSPVVAVVAEDSPFMSMGDLIAAIRERPGRLRGANPGAGTVGFAAAELLGGRALLEFEFADYSGSGPAIRALLEGDADFALLLSVEAAEMLRSGQLRALGAFGEDNFILSNGGERDIIPSVKGISGGLDLILPFGEYYGLFAPADIPARRLNGLGELIGAAADSDEFRRFADRKGLEPVDTGRETVQQFAVLLNETLYNAGYLPANPR
jgi:tripartite-type tricarboxylate transporter receptor subunit TctC